MKPKVFFHGSYVGTTGYNNHTRDFLRQLSKYIQVKVRNFTVGNSWDGYNDRCHDGEKYLDDLDRSLLYQQSLWDHGELKNFEIYKDDKKNFIHDFNIVLNETNHHFFYQNYSGPKIAYNVWESTLQPDNYFNKLLEFDELWVPSKWQKECSIKQGYPEDKIQVVPEGVDVDIFYPDSTVRHEVTSDGRFKFFLVGRWDYRKSTKEIIQTFLETFNKSEPVDLIVSIDNMWGEEMDGLKTTEERLEHYGLNDDRIKILHFPSRMDYIDILKSVDVFVSCARSEGWNLPLIESMACGVPSIYSDCCAQLEFASGRGIPVKIVGEKAANLNDYGRYTMSDLPGNYYEPDFDHLSEVMRLSYEKHETLKKLALVDSKHIREEFSWEKIGQIGYESVLNFYNKINSEEYKKTLPQNKIEVSYIDGPRVEIKGVTHQEYLIEFLDGDDQVVHSSTIHTGMWTACSRKYFTKWKIRVNGEIVNVFNPEGKTILISFESKSIGDTIAWAPYAVEFSKKYNCKVVLSTFHNDWFKGLESYKDIEFVNPGSAVSCYSVFRIGYFKTDDGSWTRFEMYPNQINRIPLQQTAADILGLEFKELNLGIDMVVEPSKIKGKYIVIAPESTAGCKEWIYENWVSLSEKLIEKGYKVISITSKPYFIPEVKNICSRPWNEVFNYLYYSEFLIGLSSGLSWINWALFKKTVMISGFSDHYNEFKYNNIRISNDVCVKCWNDPVLKFDPGDWDWCPVYKGTSMQHICQKSITVDQVLNKLPL